MNFSVHITGFDRLKDDLATIESRLRVGIASALTDVVAITHDDAVKDTPLDQGPLRETSEGTISGRVITNGTKEGAVQKASVRTVGQTFTGTIGYTQDYAVIQHENRAYKHPKAGKVKYLEGAATAREKANVERLIKAFDKL